MGVHYCIQNIEQASYDYSGNDKKYYGSEIQ